MTGAFDLGGYAELRGSYQIGVDGTPWEMVERVRPRFEIAPADRVTAEVVVEGALAQGRVLADEAAGTILASPVGDLLEAADCAYTPDPRYDSVDDYLSVERLHVDFNTPVADVSVGRQAVNWGSALVFHPTDILQEVVATEPWRERRGMNAIKADLPIGPHSFVVVAAVDDDLSGAYDDEPLPVTVAAKATVRIAATDWSVVGRSAPEGDWFAGADLRGTLGVGWWVEGGWHGDAEAPEVVVGVDYSFPVLEMLYVAAEYRYDGTGVAPDDYDWTKRAGFTTMPFDCAFLGTPEPGDRTTLGRHYGDAMARIGLTEELGVSGVVLANLADGTGMVVPDVSVEVGDRVVVHASAQIPFGTDGEFRPAAEDLTYGVGDATVDLTGLLPDATALAWLRYSF